MENKIYEAVSTCFDKGEFEIKNIDTEVALNEISNRDILSITITFVNQENLILNKNNIEEWAFQDYSVMEMVRIMNPKSMAAGIYAFLFTSGFIKFTTDSIESWVLDRLMKQMDIAEILVELDTEDNAIIKKWLLYPLYKDNYDKGPITDMERLVFENSLQKVEIQDNGSVLISWQE